MWNNRVHHGSLGGPCARNNSNGKLHHVVSYRKERKEKEKKKTFQRDSPERFFLYGIGHVIQAENVIRHQSTCRLWTGPWTLDTHERVFHPRPTISMKRYEVGWIREQPKKKRGQPTCFICARPAFISSRRARVVPKIHYRTLYSTLLLPIIIYKAQVHYERSRKKEKS